MKRDTAALTDREYDVLVVGGGMYGACIAWDAALRGLSVALLERHDFGGATSANSFKMVHGGIRYLQHGDLYRIRESSRERSALLRIAPHLVRPLPILIPTYGHGKEGREILAAGVLLYDLLVLDRNRGLRDPDRRIPAGRIVSRQECLDSFPGLEQRGLTGGVLFYDGQMYNPPRLALSFLRSATDRGAIAANYVEATDFVVDGDRVCGVVARDRLTDDRFTVSAKLVINSAGPWAERLLESSLGLQLAPPGTYSRDACFVVNQPWSGPYALAVQGRTRDPDAILSRKARHLFIVPWRDYTLVGVWHVVHSGDPDRFAVGEHELRGFIDEINAAYPPLDLGLEDVSNCNAGLVLFGENEPGAKNLSYGKRSQIVDHARVHGLDGLFTVIGVRSTTARGVADKAIRLAGRKLGRKLPDCATGTSPLYGGDIEAFGKFSESAIASRPDGMPEDVMRSLVQNHGSAYQRILMYLRQNPGLGRTLGRSAVIEAEVVHAVREEMARKLSDVVFRRTDLATGENPGHDAVLSCARLIAAELGWSQSRTKSEVNEVMQAFPSYTLSTAPERTA